MKTSTKFGGKGSVTFTIGNRRRRRRRRVVHIIRSHAKKKEGNDREQLTPNELGRGDGIAQLNLRYQLTPETRGRPNHIVQSKDKASGCTSRGGENRSTAIRRQTETSKENAKAEDLEDMEGGVAEDEGQSHEEDGKEDGQFEQAQIGVHGIFLLGMSIPWSGRKCEIQ